MANFRFKYLTAAPPKTVEYIDAVDSAAAASTVGAGNYDAAYGFITLGRTTDPADDFLKFIANLSSKIDPVAKTITLSLKNEDGGTIGTDTIDISPMFASGPPPVAVDVYAGFNATNTMTSADVVNNVSFHQQESHLHGLDVTITRSDSDNKYMYFWAPDSLGTINGFRFSGTFIDSWASTALSVGGVAGKLYISDNPTHASTVTFEVDA